MSTFFVSSSNIERVTALSRALILLSNLAISAKVYLLGFSKSISIESVSSVYAGKLIVPNNIWSESKSSGSPSPGTP